MTDLGIYFNLPDNTRIRAVEHGGFEITFSPPKPEVLTFDGIVKKYGKSEEGKKTVRVAHVKPFLSLEKEKTFLIKEEIEYIHNYKWAYFKKCLQEYDEGLYAIFSKYESGSGVISKWDGEKFIDLSDEDMIKANNYPKEDYRWDHESRDFLYIWKRDWNKYLYEIKPVFDIITVIIT